MSSIQGVFNHAHGDFVYITYAQTELYMLKKGALMVVSLSGFCILTVRKGSIYGLYLQILWSFSQKIVRVKLVVSYDVTILWFTMSITNFTLTIFCEKDHRTFKVASWQLHFCILYKCDWEPNQSRKIFPSFGD